MQKKVNQIVQDIVSNFCFNIKVIPFPFDSIFEEETAKEK